MVGPVRLEVGHQGGQSLGAVPPALASPGEAAQPAFRLQFDPAPRWRREMQIGDVREAEYGQSKALWQGHGALVINSGEFA
jgi:hypothetical protein